MSEQAEARVSINSIEQFQLLPILLVAHHTRQTRENFATPNGLLYSSRAITRRIDGNIQMLDSTWSVSFSSEG